MFSRSKNKDNGAAAKPSSSNATPPTTKRGGRAAAPSIFSTDLLVEGTLHSEGDIQIDGRIDGNIRSGSLTVGNKAVINGEIVANDVIVRGRVHGSIRARKVQLSSTAHVEGDILHNALAVESGAFFDGNCRHAEDPLTAEMPKSGQRVKADSGAPLGRAKATNGEGPSMRDGPGRLGRPLPQS
ncbi:MAG: polymer-forming cytoskeletal protein [Alphaproteobacteria bacterium]|nr:MAG: polymer-forming cytoskeletal protein [Alphaproteobacteria bacterium]